MIKYLKRMLRGWPERFCGGFADKKKRQRIEAWANGIHTAVSCGELNAARTAFKRTEVFDEYSRTDEELNEARTAF